MVVVERIPIATIIFLFVLYIVTHGGIGYYMQTLEKKLKAEPKDEETKKQFKWVKIVFKWYAFVYLGLLLIAFISSQ